MKNKLARVAAWFCLAVGMGQTIPAQAEEQGRFYGMLRSRDLTPFGFLRLDMRPAHAVSIEKHTFAFEAELGYQNTWALSENVEKYLKSLEGSGRRAIGPAEIQAIRDLPGENYLFDLESATLDMAVHYKISSQWTAYAFATAVSYQGGFLDSTIEGFHDAGGPQQLRSSRCRAEWLAPHLRPQAGEGSAVECTEESRVSSTRRSGCATAASHYPAHGRCRWRPR